MLDSSRGAAGWSSLASLRCGPWARHINPSLVLVQPRKTLPFITERLLMGRKESNQKISLCIWTDWSESSMDTTCTCSCCCISVWIFLTNKVVTHMYSYLVEPRCLGLGYAYSRTVKALQIKCTAHAYRCLLYLNLHWFSLQILGYLWIFKRYRWEIPHFRKDLDAKCDNVKHVRRIMAGYSQNSFFEALVGA